MRQSNVKQEFEHWKQLPPAQRWLRLKSTSLTGKLVLLFIAVVLPINVLMVVITGFVEKSYEQRISESYSYQLRLYTQAAGDQFSAMELDMREFLRVDNLLVLTKGTKLDSTLDTMRFKTELSDSEVWNTYPGMYYIWDKEKDIFSINGAGKSYTSEVKKGLEQQIRGRAAVKAAKKNREILKVDNHAFLFQKYDYTFFSVGILFDVESVLAQFKQELEEMDGTIYLADQKENLIASLTGEHFVCEEAKALGREWSEKKYLIVAQPLGYGEFQLIHKTPRSSYMKDLSKMVTVLYVLCICSFLAIPLLLFVARHLVLKPVQELCLAMEEVESGNLEYQIDGKTGSYQMDFLFLSFNHMLEELHHMVTESYEKEIERLQTDAINIRLQVNQHMLLNFLNTIYSLSRTGRKEEVEQFTLLLMNYFRYVLRQDMGLVTVKEEMKFVQDYLKLQKIRFPDSFHLAYSMTEEAEDLLIPQLLIQNFVENTIKYGLIMGKEIEILINIRTEGEWLILSISDTGNGMDEERVKKLQQGEIIEDSLGKHIGIWNCRRRLKYYYGDLQEMNIISSQGQGTQVFLKLRREPLTKPEAAAWMHQEQKQVTEGEGHEDINRR